MLVNTIRKLAEDRCLSMNKLEQAVGLAPGTINKWDRNTPSVLKVKTVADYFGVTVDDLLTETGEEATDGEDTD